MKSCPVCHARTFDDARICYGCLYDYDRGESDARPKGSGFAPNSDAAEPDGGAVPGARGFESGKPEGMLGGGSFDSAELAAAERAAECAGRRSAQAHVMAFPGRGDPLQAGEAGRTEPSGSSGRLAAQASATGADGDARRSLRDAGAQAHGGAEGVAAEIVMGLRWQGDSAVLEINGSHEVLVDAPCRTTVQQMPDEAPDGPRLRLAFAPADRGLAAGGEARIALVPSERMRVSFG